MFIIIHITHLVERVKLSTRADSYVRTPAYWSNRII